MHTRPPVSTTTVMSSIVSDVSAIFVLRMIYTVIYVIVKSYETIHICHLKVARLKSLEDFALSGFGNGTV